MKCFFTVEKKPLLRKALLIMKLTALLILFFTLNVSAKGFGQKINLRVKKTEIAGILSSIEKQTNYRFLYNNDLGDIREKVTLNVKDADLLLVLDLLLQNTKLLYQQMENNLIVIKESENIAEQRPDVTIRGKITSDDGTPLTGVSIQIKGTNVGTTTNTEGNFTLTVPNANVTLVVSYVGYVSQEINLAGRTEVSASLTVSTKVIDGCP